MKSLKLIIIVFISASTMACQTKVKKEEAKDLEVAEVKKPSAQELQQLRPVGGRVGRSPQLILGLLQSYRQVLSGGDGQGVLVVLL